MTTVCVAQESNDEPCITAMRKTDIDTTLAAKKMKSAKQVNPKNEKGREIKGNRHPNIHVHITE